MVCLKCPQQPNPWTFALYVQHPSFQSWKHQLRDRPYLGLGFQGRVKGAFEIQTAGNVHKKLTKRSVVSEKVSRKQKQKIAGYSA